MLKITLATGNKHKVEEINLIAKDYKEANGIKPLCETDEAYKNLCVFIDTLSSFYDYE